ncbi:MAG: Fe-S oxidoreductase, partial [Casimicrobiaceae bacterium]
MTREGNLEAPTRHPLDWRNPDFYAQASFDTEAARIFDICHGCRRCVSLCGAFPTLFDLVDATSSGEVDQVERKDFAKVVDQCYLCDVCYMTKCPYVPPHPWNVDFPHLMLRGKAIRHADGDVSVRDRVLSATDRVGTLASIPVVAQTVNWANRTPAVRAVMDKTLGIAAATE